MRFSDLSAPARTLWAKSGDVTGYGVLVHMLDVASVAEQILLREPAQTLTWIARQLGLPHPGIVRWLAALAGLHDFGKAIPGFQSKCPAVLWAVLVVTALLIAVPAHPSGAGG